MLLDGVAAIKFLVGGNARHFYAILRAHIHFYKSFSKFYNKRSASSFGVVGLHPLIYRRSIVMQYFICGKKNYRDL
jgi:hypothetical protein